MTYLHRSDVAPEDVVLLSTDGPWADGVDPTGPGMGHHLTFDRILRRCGQAWMAFLGELGPGLFGPDRIDVIAPHVEADYAREVGVGPLQVAVTVEKLGRTSFTLRLAASQDGRVAATVRVVLVAFDYAGRTPIELPAEHRSALGEHLSD